MSFRNYLLTFPGKRLEALLVLICLLLGAFWRLWQPDLGYFSIHTSRDLYRSLLLLRGIEIPLLGSEMQYGGRVPGPAMYYICLLPMAFSTSGKALAIFIGLWNTALLAITWYFTRRFLGPAVALVALIFYAFFPLEIAQLRLNWNPCFLTAFTALTLFSLWKVVLEHKPWWLVGLFGALSIGIQLHMSAAELILPVLVTLALTRPRIPIRIWTVAIVLIAVLFSPLAVHELTAPKSSLVEAIQSNESMIEGSQRYRFNENAVRNFFLHVRLNMFEGRDDRDILGFHLLDMVRRDGDFWLGKRAMAGLWAIHYFSQVQILFWLAGAAACIMALRRRGTDSQTWWSITDTNQTYARTIGGTLLMWQAMPILFLLFFNYHGNPGEPMSIAPIRYYLVCYPAPFLTSAIGAVVLTRLLIHKIRWPYARLAVPIIIAGLALGYNAFNFMYLRLLKRSDWAIPYIYPNHAPTMRLQYDAVDILLGEARLDRDAFFNRTHTQRFGDYLWGESTLDYALTQDERSLTNPPPDPHLRWLLHSHLPSHRHPKLPEGATETRRWEIRDGGFTIVEYRVDDPNRPVPKNDKMRNYYYQDPTMQYLGPDNELRDPDR